MPRTPPEWVGKNDDEPVPDRVKTRVFNRDRWICQVCTRRLYDGDSPHCDHMIALINGGLNRESNLQTVCKWCHGKKTKSDVATKAKTYRLQRKRAGIKTKKYRPLPGTRASGTRKRMSGKIERW